MLTHRRLVLSCLLFALSAPACGGRSGLDDFSKGADDLITGNTSGSGSGGGNGGRNADNTGGDQGEGGHGSDSDGGAQNSGGNADNGNNANNGNNGNNNGPGGSDAPVGAACKSDSSCDDKNAECLTEESVGGFLMIEFPEGYCAVQGCEEDDDCPDGSGCFNAIGLQYCLQTCDSDRDCRVRDGYACNAIGGGGPGGGGFPGGGGGGGGAGGGQQGPSYCLPPFGGGGGFPGGN